VTSPSPAAQGRAYGSPATSGTGRAALVRLAVASAVLAALAVAVSDQTFLTGEVAMLDWVNDLPSGVGWVLRAAMPLGTVTVALAIVAVVAGCTWRRELAPSAATLGAVVVAYRADNVVKAVISRPRPPGLLAGLQVRETISGFGFPSGHTTMAFALAATVAPTLPRPWRPLPWVLAAAVGLARLYVGVHWPADVVGGAALGTAVGSASWLVAHAWARRDSNGTPTARLTT
jgi:glycosyltransferase 2 family protein